MIPTSIHESNPVTVAVSPNVEYAYKAKALYDCKFIVGFIFVKKIKWLENEIFIAKLFLFINIWKNIIKHS
jgi:hypothetical protein